MCREPTGLACTHHLSLLTARQPEPADAAIEGGCKHGETTCPDGENADVREHRDWATGLVTHCSRVTPSSGSPVWQCEPPRQQLVGPQTNRDKRSCLHTSGYTAKFNLSPFIQHFSNPVQLVNYIQLSFELISINNSNF